VQLVCLLSKGRVSDTASSFPEGATRSPALSKNRERNHEKSRRRRQITTATTTYDDGVTSLFFNGELIGVHADTRLFGNDSANNRLVIGGRLGGSKNEQTNGLIDGLRVYDTVLSADEIRAAAAASVSAVPEPGVACLG
jgi:hypothetical protein